MKQASKKGRIKRLHGTIYGIYDDKNYKKVNGSVRNGRCEPAKGKRYRKVKTDGPQRRKFLECFVFRCINAGCGRRVIHVNIKTNRNAKRGFNFNIGEKNGLE